MNPDMATGYPYRKRGQEIYLKGRITAIVDVFDALYNRRIYKDPWSLEKIQILFEEECVRHFDPELVDCFIENIDEIVEVQTVYSARHKHIFCRNCSAVV
ncbi:MULTISPECIES: HD-GYP domain-containing protein [unclassified Oceanispirochaeta]|uniref:HD-GYP domain-containing protein n=1 Tax=unclassified Oceanispirochaeta TaxID=2635722 RepID=UPI0011C06AC1|nr:MULTISPECIES: HD domain-containing phosphohydrolase [unclassified Oceanispirochaeta]MBF9017304.1 hypothetical protein [Oceanispirochaeta sp. M2]NPD73814.1 hypothetical protein [Oceanispirochaeta sp. M1]